MKEFKPCPFCGENYAVELSCNSETWSWAYKKWNVGCSDCGVWFDFIFDTDEEAIEAWNTRADKAVD